MSATSSPVEILHIEDNEGDIILTQLAFKRTKWPVHISVAHTGREALDILNKAKEEEGELTKPQLILLDLNLPEINGIEFLQMIRKDSKLEALPILVVSSSTNQRDIREAEQNKANGYIIKPYTSDRFTDMVKQIENFWETHMQDMKDKNKIN